jgi:hypothetical protein
VKIQKIIGLVALAIAVVAAFVNIPYAAVILAILGIPIGLATAGDAHVRVLVSALVLNLLGHAFDALPAVGLYVGGIIGNVGIFAAGAALAIVFKNIYRRVTE